MALKTFKPNTPSNRYKQWPSFEEITKHEPQKSLTVALRKSGGRNNTGRITCRHIGGGVAWGPKPRDFSKATPKNVKRLAFRTALTARIQDGDVLTIGSFSVADGKTKTFVSTVQALTDSHKILLVGKFDEMTFRAGRNVQSVQLISAEDVNAEHLLNYDKVLMTSEALETLARRTA